jgi:hypothetical protein
MDARTHSWQWLLRNLYFMSCEQIFFCSYSYVVHTEYIISPKEFKSRVTRISFALLSGKTGLSAVKYFVNININVMQLILVNIKWKYVIQKFHEICLSYYFNDRQSSEQNNRKLISLHNAMAGTINMHTDLQISSCWEHISTWNIHE